VRKLDPLALAFFGAALALLAGLVCYVLFFKTPEPAQPTRASDFLAGLGEQLERAIDGLRDSPKPPAPEPAKPAPAPAPSAAKPAPAAPASVPGKGAQSPNQAPRIPVSAPPAGQTWVYRVAVEPPVWQDIVLAYRVEQKGGDLAVQTDFTHAKGNMRFALGTFRAGHPSHANTRFPGFFLYPAYFGQHLQTGQQLAWEWPWQIPGGGVKAGRVKRFTGRVVGTEQHSSAAIPMSSAARIELRIDYVEDGKVLASVRENILFAAKAAQIVRIVREGRAPDEGSSRIVAEFAEFR
jgi:hypothetical protein